MVTVPTLTLECFLSSNTKVLSSPWIALLTLALTVFMPIFQVCTQFWERHRLGLVVRKLTHQGFIQKYHSICLGLNKLSTAIHNT